MTNEEALLVNANSYLRDLSDGKIFRVLCNCGSSHPRRHTQRFVQQNPQSFERVTSQELAAHLGVPFNQE